MPAPDTMPDRTNDMSLEELEKLEQRKRNQQELQAELQKFQEEKGNVTPLEEDDWKQKPWDEITDSQKIDRCRFIILQMDKTITQMRKQLNDVDAIARHHNHTVQGHVCVAPKEESPFGWAEHSPANQAQKPWF